MQMQMQMDGWLHGCVAHLSLSYLLVQDPRSTVLRQSSTLHPALTTHAEKQTVIADNKDGRWEMEKHRSEERNMHQRQQ